MKKWNVYIGLIVAMTFWSLSFIWYKQVYIYYKPFTTVFIRLLISSFVLFATGLIFRQLQRPRKQDLVLLILLASFNPFLYFIGESLGLTMVSSGLSAVIISTIPLFTPVAAHYFYRERLSGLNMAGMGISFTGILVIIIRNDFTIAAPIQGILLLFMAVFMAVAYNIVLKNLSHKYNAISLITWQNLTGMLLFIPLFLAFDLDQLSRIGFQKKALLPLLEMAILASSVAFILFARGVRDIGAARASLFSNIVPALTVVFAYFILGEELNLRKILGIIIVITGLFFSQLGSNLILPRVRGRQSPAENGEQ